MRAKAPANQAARLRTIRQYDLGQRVHEGKLAGLVELAAEVTGCPIALVSIVHEDAQRFKATCGVTLDGTGLEFSICAHAILQEDFLEIPDCRLDPRTRNNPLVTDENDPLRFYADAQILTDTGVALGSFCVLDRVPRALTPTQRRTLQILAEQAMRTLELHQAVRDADHLRREADHRVKNSLSSIAAVARMTASRAQSDETRAALEQVQSRIEATARLHAELYNQDIGEDDIEITGYLSGIVGHLTDMAPPDVAVEHQIAPLRLPSRSAAAMGLLVNEMISNAYKHGFADGRAGTILLSAGPDDDEMFVLRCVDDGSGPTLSEAGSGLGSLLMEASAIQLGGAVTQGAQSDEPGYVVSLTMPMPKP